MLRFSSIAIPIGFLLFGACDYCFYRPTGEVIRGNPRSVTTTSKQVRSAPAPDTAFVQQTDHLYKVAGDVKAPVAITRTDIAFDECQKEKTPIGMPIVEAVITEDGQVQEARLLKPLPRCAEDAVLTAVRTWRFRPATVAGRPVRVSYTFTVLIHYR